MQTVLVILIVSAAVVYLGYRAYATWWAKPSDGCDKCGMNPKSPAAKN